MLRHNITAKEADGHPCVMFMVAKEADGLTIYAPTASEPNVEAGGEHQVVALVVGDILQGGLHIDVMVNV